MNVVREAEEAQVAHPVSESCRDDIGGAGALDRKRPDVRLGHHDVESAFARNRPCPQQRVAVRCREPKRRRVDAKGERVVDEATLVIAHRRIAGCAGLEISQVPGAEIRDQPVRIRSGDLHLAFATDVPDRRRFRQRSVVRSWIICADRQHRVVVDHRLGHARCDSAVRERRGPGPGADDQLHSDLLCDDPDVQPAPS